MKQIKISPQEVRKHIKAYTFKQEGMGISVSAKKMNEFKKTGGVPSSIGFFMGNCNQAAYDIAKFLSEPRQQERLAGFLKDQREGIFSSVMKYNPNDSYVCKGILASKDHSWKDGAVDLEWILIRFLKKDGRLRIISIYPVLDNGAAAKEEEENGADEI